MYMYVTARESLPVCFIQGSSAGHQLHWLTCVCMYLQAKFALIFFLPSVFVIVMGQSSGAEGVNPVGAITCLQIFISASAVCVCTPHLSRQVGKTSLATSSLTFISLYLCGSVSMSVLSCSGDERNDWCHLGQTGQRFQP